MKRFPHITFTMMVVLGLANCAMPEAPARTALVYGISIYDISGGEGASGTNNLTYTDDDARAMSSLLSYNGWTVKEGIANTQDPAESQDATREAIEADISSLASAAPEGLVLFYYSGHGTEDYLGTTYIIPFGAIENQSDRISAEELFEMFEDAGISNVIIILDSCNSGGFVYEGATVDAVPPVYGEHDNNGDIEYSWFVDSAGDAMRGYLSYSAEQGYVVLSAAGAGEFSWETSGHGIFTAAILSAGDTSEADLDGDGYLATSELFAFCVSYIDSNWNENNATTFSGGMYADYLPHLSGTPREYALWATQ